MKLLYFHQHFTTPGGTVGIRSYQMAKALVAQGHQVTMICGRYNGGDTGLSGPFRHGRRQGMLEGLHIVEFDLAYHNSDGLLKRSCSFLRYALGGIVIALTHRYDLVFATTTPLTAGIPGIFAKWLRRKTFVFEVRDLWPELPREMGVIRNPVILALLSALEWLSYRSADRCVALSPGIADGIARRGVHVDRVATIPNGCDIGIFGGEEHSRWRPEGVPDRDLMAIFAGTHGQANGLDALLDAAAVLKARGRSDIWLVLVGDGKLKPALVARARALGLTNLVFHDPVNKEKVAGLMAAADIGIQSLTNVPAFYYGTSPNKFFDYIAAGLPVLNNYPGWLAALIEQYDCGFAVAPDDPEAFADALELAHHDREALKRKGVNAAKLAREEFARQDLAAKWVDWVTQGRRS